MSNNPFEWTGEEHIIGCVAEGNSGGMFTPSEDALYEPEVEPVPCASEAFSEAMKSYRMYEEAVSRLAIEEDLATRDKNELDGERMQLMAQTDPAAMGKNEEQRKAWLYRETESHTLQLQSRLRTVELLKAEAEIARIRCRRQDITLRYMELLAASVPGLKDKEEDHA